MQLFRHLGLMIAVFWCAAMVVAPMAAAAGAGQDTNHAPQNMGPGQSGSGQGFNGNGLFQQGDRAGNAGPGQGGRPQGMDRGNMTGFMNRTNMALPEKPDRDPDNATAMNMTGWHGPRGNMTGMNVTNMTPPDQPPRQGSGNGQGWQGSGQPQAGNRNDSGNSMVSELVSWLKAHGIS
ncbi:MULTISPECIES: hypothetical protein [unclassified Methanoregula]|uniref:hypothetical protein n=1 Tax=unclassified Methanoregula TaxID=2649730 RepID=UPI0009CE4808|nr:MULTISPECIES: hypothetical protein [unclassified Methanoregula]OPX64405.1 MAG: hypothetical protein A4E33_00986 [Methanoregula sp. PtaB.Bin085]OPY34925.1 MAG: hypothetical protein A4E34_01161 [Methanoregula sp. PtaU1.Bin006]